MPHENTPRRRRPRPVGDLAIGPLAPAAERIAKGWLLELIDAGPIAAAAAVPAADLAAGAPRLCEAVLRAVGSDADLERLEAGGEHARLAASAGQLAGAADAAGTLAAVEALRAVIHSELRDRLRLRDAEPAAELAERLALVCSSVADAALQSLDAAGGRTVVTPPGTGEPREGHDSELADIHPLTVRRGEGEAGGDAGQPLWIVALEREIARSTEEPGRRFALLLVEIDGEAQITAAAGGGEDAVFDRVAAALRQAVRRPDLIAHEPDGRTWVIAPDCGRSGAAALAGRIAVAVERAAAPRGAPLTASIGVAVFPEDGRAAQALIDDAEERMWAARAAGVRVEGTGPPEPGGPRSVG